MNRKRGWKNFKKDKHPCWKGGRIIDRYGYIRIYAPDHFAPRRGGYILQHRYLMELKINRPLLKTEIVHHKNHDRQDNRLSNLEIVDRSSHSRHHRTLDAHKFKRNTKGRYVDLSR